MKTILAVNILDKMSNIQFAQGLNGVLATRLEILKSQYFKH